MKTWEDLSKRFSVLAESISELMQRHETLQSFRDAREWDNDAQALMDLLIDFKNDYIAIRNGQEKLLEQLNQERGNKSFFKRVLSSHSDENKVKEAIKVVDSVIEKIGGLIEDLYERMDKTPANGSEQKEITDELKQLKKELTLQKREANENLRQTMSSARQQVASWTGVTGGTLGRIARHQRTSARLEKERALAPIEDLKAFIEGKLIALERDLNWVTHFKGDDQEDESQSLQEGIISEQVPWCKYCGRRVNDMADVCSGCGAVI